MKNVLVLFFIALVAVTMSCNNKQKSAASDDAFPVVTAPDPGKTEKSGTREAADGGKWLFCFIVNGQHLPALAVIEKGYDDANVIPNGQPFGYNWDFTPGTPETANVGRLQDGRIFIKKVFLEQYIVGIPRLKSAGNGWQEQVCQTETVGGQAAYTWK